MRLTTVLLALVCAPAIAMAQPAPKGTDPKPASTTPPKKDEAPKPPSTGKELAQEKVVLPADDQAKLARAIIAKKDCKGSEAKMLTALSVGASKLTEAELITGFGMLQKCSRAAKRWESVITATLYLLDHAPDKSHPEELIGALVAVGETKAALAYVDLVRKKFPKLKGNIAAALAMMACRNNDYKKCFDASSSMMTILKDKGGPDVQFKNLVYHAMSAAALGKYDVYDADWKEIEKIAKANKLNLAGFEPFKLRIEQARQDKVFVDWDLSKQLPLGTYHYMTSGKIADAGALLTLRIVNQDKALRTFKVTVQVPGITEPMTVSIPARAGETVSKTFTPPLRVNLDATKIRAPRDGQITVSITDAKSRASIMDQSFAVSVLPRDHLMLSRYIGSEENRKRTRGNSLAWVTPNATEIDAFLKKAKERVADKSFVGEQGPTLPQVKALFEELRAQGVTYVMDPDLFDDSGFFQRTRLPSEVIASSNAQCLEGTLLYATLFEAIGIKPYLVYVPGHAFVGWKPSKYDKVKMPVLFLETTMTGGKATFEQVVGTAIGEVAEHKVAFDRGIAELIDVAALRQKGYSPMPF